MDAPPDTMTHSPRWLHDPARWVLYLSHVPPERLVVFVHGFYGGPVGTWQRFPEGSSAWWQSSDLLFVGYDSIWDNITGTAARLLRALPRFYPELPAKLQEIDGVCVRKASGRPYRELFPVGHSLGGVVVRRALCDAAYDWLVEIEDDPTSSKPVILEASVRLFSPASAGFRPAGKLGLVRATPAWRLVNMLLRRSSAFTDLQPDSPILNETRNRTEALVEQDKAEWRSLRARILWANPDDVVVTERYRTDFGDDAVDATTHKSVCKPNGAYHVPWLFVEHGKLAKTTIELGQHE